MSDFSATIRTILDLSNIDAQLKAIESKSVTLKSIKIDTTGIASQIQKALNSTKINVNLGGSNTGGASKNVNGLTQSYNELLKTAKQISKVEIKLHGLDGGKNANLIQEYKSQLEELRKTYDETKSKLEEKLSSNQFDALTGKTSAVFKEMETAMREFDAKLADTKAQMNDNIQFKIDTGQFSMQVEKIKQQFDSLQDKPEQVAKNVRELEAAFQTMASNAGVDDRIKAFDRYNKLLPVVQQQVHGVSQAEMELVRVNAQILSNNIDTWMNKNTQAAEKYSNELNELKTRLANVKSPADLKKCAADFKLIQSNAKSAGLVVSQLGKTLGNAAKQFLGIGTAAMALQKVVQVGRKMLEEVKAVDSAMVELRKVTNETAAAYESFYGRVGKNAQKIGTTMSDLITSTADFGRLGYSLNEAEGLAQVANVYSVVGDEIDGIEEATKSLISTMQAFKGEMTSSMSNTDFATNIIDKFNEVGNNFAISSGGIGEALERSASSLSAANNTLDESIALITAANTVVQNPESIGTAYKTKFCLYVQKCA